MYRVVTVREGERAFLFENGKFSRVLGPGRYRFANFSQKIEIDRHSVLKAEVPEAIATVIEKNHPDIAEEHFEIVQTGEGEVAIVSFDGVPTHLMGPWKKRVFWKALNTVTVKMIDTSKDIKVEKEDLNAIQTSTTTLVQDVTVNQHEAGLLFVDGELKEELDPGRHAFWAVHHQVRVETLDLRPIPHEITAQEILTKDRVSLRVTLTAFTQVTHPEKAVQETSDYATYIYRLTQFAVREAVSTRTLDQILNNRETVDNQVRTYVDVHLGDIGVSVNELGLKDIILPGEMRELINKVVEAEKVAQANLIRRREETAATRSLLNTARLMENNPLLLRLKEIEALEKLTEKVGKIKLVTGGEARGFDSLLHNLLHLEKAPRQEDDQASSSEEDR